MWVQAKLGLIESDFTWQIWSLHEQMLIILIFQSLIRRFFLPSYLPGDFDYTSDQVKLSSHLLWHMWFFFFFCMLGSGMETSLFRFGAKSNSWLLANNSHLVSTYVFVQGRIHWRSVQSYGNLVDIWCACQTPPICNISVNSFYNKCASLANRLLTVLPI